MIRRLGIYIVIGIIFSTYVGVCVSSTDAYAHRSGCHRWHSCPSDSGSYSCGDTGYDNYCGTTSYEAYSPVVTTREEESYSDIPNKVVEQPNYSEYIGYRNQLVAGGVGRSRVVTTVTMTDGVESSRSDIRANVVSKPVDKVYSVGAREKPTAYIDSFWKESDKKFLWMTTGENYTITAAGEPYTNFALVLNGNTVQLERSNARGYLSFHNIDLNDRDTLEIGSYTDDKFLWFMPSVQKKSETTTVLSVAKGLYVTAYDALHNKTQTAVQELTSDLKECSDDVRKKYLDLRTNVDKMRDKAEGSITVYYPEPCTIDIENNA